MTTPDPEDSDDIGPITPPPRARYAYVRGELHGLLRWVDAEGAIQLARVPDDGDFTLGRAPECSLSLDEVSLSKVHAWILPGRDGFEFHDNGSTNGSYVNQARVSAPVVLKDGALLQLGSSTLLRFSLVTESEERAMRAASRA